MHLRVLLPGFLALACTSAEPRPPAPTPAEPPPPPPPTTTPEAAPVQPAEPEVPTPATDPIAAALAPTDPATIAIVDRKAVGKDTIVLFANDVVATRQGNTQDDYCEEVRKRSLSCEVACRKARCDAAQREACNPKDPYDMRSCVYGESTFAWEIARVRESGAAIEIVARMRLWGPAPGEMPSSDAPHKLKVYDVDGDKRSEVTVIVPIEVTGGDDDPVEGDGEVGAILDAGDLHLQFAVTRRVDTRREDVFDSEAHAATTWVAKDVDGDRHPDLTLTTKLMQKDNNGCDVSCDDEEAAERPVRSSAKQVCPYEIAGDRWVCPSPQLGLELLAGNDGVQAIAAAP